MAVNMLMDQVNFEEQVEIVQNCTGGAFGNNGVAFSHNNGPVGNFLDWHPAPRRQFVITLSGLDELECGDGSQRRLGPGDILLAEDTTGQGHITREIRPRRVIFIPILEEFDISAWRGR